MESFPEAGQHTRGRRGRPPGSGRGRGRPPGGVRGGGVENETGTSGRGRSAGSGRGREGAAGENKRKRSEEDAGVSEDAPPSKKIYLHEDVPPGMVARDPTEEEKQVRVYEQAI